MGTGGFESGRGRAKGERQRRKRKGTATMDVDKVLSFDENNRLRILEPEQHKATDSLRSECTDFVQNITHFNEMVGKFVTTIDQQAQAIENAKLRAVGQRIQVETEVDARKRKQAELQAQLREKQVELDRLTAQYESLLQIEREQKSAI